MNIGLDYAWFGVDAGQCRAPARLQYYFGVTRAGEPYRIYETDGRVIERPALHPTAITAATAAGTLALPEQPNAASLSDQGTLAREWIERFWELPMRKGERRYYDNCLYLFAFLALSGKYRIY